MTTRASDEHGMIGKLLVLWLLVLALIGVAAFDGVSIMVARFQLSDAATRAATDAAAALNRGQAASEVCDVAAATVEEHQPDARRPRRGWCLIDESEGRVTITLRTEAGTLLAGRLSFTEDWTRVTVQESTGRSAL